MSIHDGKPVQSWETGLQLHQGEDWEVLPDMKPDPDPQDSFGFPVLAKMRSSRSGVEVPAATLRRIGWVDQKGRVWLEIPPAIQFDGGSLTPLLIDPGERDGL